MGVDLPVGPAAHQSTAEALLNSFTDIAASELRRHAMVFNYWLSIRGELHFPLIQDLDPMELSDAGPSSVLLELIGAGEDAEIRHIGQEIASGDAVEKISEAASPSILSCIAARLPEVANSRRALSFEEEFTSAEGTTRCWITLLPFSSTGTWVDYVYGFTSSQTAGSQAEDPAPAEAAEAGESDAEIDPPAEVAEPFEPAAEPEAETAAAEPEPEPEPEPVAQETEAPAAPDGDLPARLADVRALAGEAQAAKLRAEAALCEALGAAYDFALDAENDAETYLKLVEEQGLKIQLRSPMTPVARLAFAGSCDGELIPRLEAVLAWALKADLPRGSLSERIAAEGGLGPILAGEKQLR